jgi:hypothetical protein
MDPDHGGPKTSGYGSPAVGAEMHEAVPYLKRLTKARSVQAACVPMRAAQKMVLSLLLEISRSSLLHDSNCQLIWTIDRDLRVTVFRIQIQSGQWIRTDKNDPQNHKKT